MEHHQGTGSEKFSAKVGSQSDTWRPLALQGRDSEAEDGGVPGPGLSPGAGQPSGGWGGGQRPGVHHV